MSIKVSQDESTFKIEQVDRVYDGTATEVLKVTGTTVYVNGADVNKVTTSDIVAGSVTKAKTAMFISTEQTGTGSSQNVAHGLGSTPVAVFVTPTDLTPATVGSYSVVEGVHDATNVKVTVTSGKKFKVMAWL